MNGRIYSPNRGRFLQPDPVIQSPGNTQSWNAYTYVFNNPLTYTDPTGMMSLSFRQIFAVAFAAVYAYFTWDLTGAAAVYAAMIGGAITGAIATGTWRGAITGAFTGAVTAGIGLAANAGDWGNLARVGAQAVSGGVMESLQGGSFGNGFAAAGLTAAFMPQAGYGNAAARSVKGALIGGTISEVTGGKFANGAISGAMQGAMSGESGRAVEPDGSLASGSASDTGEYADTHNIRQVDLAPGLNVTSVDEVAINNINDALARFGRAVYASGNQEGIRDYNAAKLLYDPQAVADYSAKYGVNAAAYTNIKQGKITFGRTNFAYASNLRGYFGDQTSRTLLPMKMSSVYTGYITHEFGHLHSQYIIAGELGSANYLRYMRPYLRSTGTMMLPNLPRL